MQVKFRSRACIALLRNSVLLAATLTFAIDSAVSAPLLPVAPSTSATSSLVQVRAAGAPLWDLAAGPSNITVVQSPDLAAGPIAAARPSSAREATSRFGAPRSSVAVAAGPGPVDTTGQGAEPSPPAPRSES
jgi:hypothetical protein